ncbi:MULTISPECIES: hypothetical protein [unclassified Staphylococcus]|uniref:hypothetical protein n=1 Tax=unclassified Staphylococcus TaxID=91994 RepID=UPI001AEBE720|nr:MULTISPECIES: hypothetical protein [unclassified Staphylococcus]
MKSKSLLLFLTKLIIALIGFVLIIKFSNSFVADAANGGSKNFKYFLYIVITLFIAFILSPILLNVVFKNTNSNSLSMYFLKSIGTGTKEVTKDTLNLNDTSKHNKKEKKNNNIDDLIVDYFLYAKNINHIKDEKTQLNYRVSNLVSDIDGIMLDAPKLIKEAKAFDNSESSNKLFTSSSSVHGTKVTYISKNKVEIETGYITIIAPLQICERFTDFNKLSPYLRPYLKPKNHTL